VRAGDRTESTMRSGMQNVKNAILNDLGEFTKAHPDPSSTMYAEWLAAMVAKFDAWRQRLVKPTQ
jgi:hypothetical protein